MFLKNRTQEPELMDLGSSHFSKDEYEKCLLLLGRIGTVLRGNHISLGALKRIRPFNSILDIGCGGGDFAYLLAKKFPGIVVKGVDLEKLAIDFASSRFKLPNLSFTHVEDPKLSYPDKSFDIVTATLVCHHLDGEALTAFLSQAYRIARKSVVINDLHRHSVAYGGFAVLSSLFFRNRLIQHDGLISIRKGFKRQEWKEVLKLASIPLEKVRISWKWPFRWCVEIYTE